MAVGLCTLPTRNSREPFDGDVLYGVGKFGYSSLRSNPERPRSLVRVAGGVVLRCPGRWGAERNGKRRQERCRKRRQQRRQQRRRESPREARAGGNLLSAGARSPSGPRSEERRVGKECR